jgi:hypothetical protein
LVAQTAPLHERVLVAAIGPLITVVLGGLVVWAALLRFSGGVRPLTERCCTLVKINSGSEMRPEPMRFGLRIPPVRTTP